MTGVGIAARAKAGTQGDIPSDRPAHPQHASPALAKSPSFLRPRPAPGTPNAPSWGKEADRAAKKAAQEPADQNWRSSRVRPPEKAEKSELPAEIASAKPVAETPADPPPSGERVEIEDVYKAIKMPVRAAMWLRSRAEAIKSDSEKIAAALDAEADDIDDAVVTELKRAHGAVLAEQLVGSVQRFYGDAEQGVADVEAYVRENHPKAGELLDLERKLANL